MSLNFKKALNIGTLGISGALDSALHPGTTTASQVPLETPEQRQAREFLAQFMKTGSYGGFNAGADIGIRGPNTSLTPLEQTGQSSLTNLLSSSLPSGYALGDSALRDLLTTNVNDIQAQFDPFKTQVQNQIAQSNKDLLRTAGVTGNLYSTNTIQNLGGIQKAGNDTLTAKLAELTDTALNRRMQTVLQAIPLAYSSASNQENTVQNRIASAFNYGGLSRTLQNQGTDAANAELLRRRNESLLPLNTATQLSSTNANFGVPSITTQNPNPMLDLLTALISGGSKIAAAKGA